MSRLRSLLMAAVLGIVAACSGGGGAGEAPATTTTTRSLDIQPCSVVTDQQVAAIAPDLAHGVTDADSGPTTCAWRNINGLAVVTVRLTRVGPDGIEDELRRSGWASDTFLEVPNVGEEAFAVLRGRKSAGRSQVLDALYARKGDLVVIVGTPGLNITATSGDDFAAIVSAANAALAAAA